MRRLKAICAHKRAEAHKYSFTLRVKSARSLEAAGCPPGAALLVHISRGGKKTLSTEPARWRPHNDGSAIWEEEISLPSVTLYTDRKGAAVGDALQDKR